MSAQEYLSSRAYPPSMLPKLHHQSVIGFGCFLLFRQKALHQHRRGVCTSLFPAGCLGRTRVNPTLNEGSGEEIPIEDLLLKRLRKGNGGETSWIVQGFRQKGKDVRDVVFFLSLHLK